MNASIGILKKTMQAMQSEAVTLNDDITEMIAQLKTKEALLERYMGEIKEIQEAIQLMEDVYES